MDVRKVAQIVKVLQRVDLDGFADELVPQEQREEAAYFLLNEARKSGGVTVFIRSMLNGKPVMGLVTLDAETAELLGWQKTS